MINILKNIIKQMPYFGNLLRQVENQGEFPAGHYYSPIPDKHEIDAYFKTNKFEDVKILDLDFNKENQFVLLSRYAKYYNELPFPEKKNEECRFFYHNDFFSYGDAIFLYSFLREFEPRRIIEIGSGFSSAVMLDTIDRFFPFRPEIVFIEPDSNRLRSLLRRSDKDRIKIIEKKIQDVSPTLFSALEQGDLLFIDSSHVVKCGSDLQRLMFDVLPLLRPGVFVHFHDIFYPFEYPPDWLKAGRFWNENYFLRAFLSYNREWRIHFFNSYVTLLFSDFIKEKLPLCEQCAGSLYIQRVMND